MAGQISEKLFNFFNLGRAEGGDAAGCGGGDAGVCGSGGCSSGGCGSDSSHSVLDKQVGRRGALGMLFGGAAAGASAVKAQASVLSEESEKEQKLLEWEEYFKGNFRLMSAEEKAQTVERLTSLARIKSGRNVHIKASDANEGVLYGYAFNISKCKGYRECVKACVQENNLDRNTEMQYIRIFEMKNGEMNLEEGDTEFHHQVPAAGHFYIGTQCFQCADPPCTKVCPVGATWHEPDGITVVDYDWCIGCRYCQAACPYWARRFNCSEPEVPAEEVNPNQHYLGNRARKKGVMEKCTFCIQRSREGRLPACAEACPTGARIFGNLLDPNSDIRYVLAHKKVFRLKEDLGTEPKFWYFMD